MILKHDKIDLTLNVKVDNFNCVIYVTTNTMKCFGCGQIGHLLSYVLKIRKTLIVQVQQTTMQMILLQLVQTVLDKSSNDDQDTVKETVADELTGAETDECMQNSPKSTSSVVDMENVLDNVDVEKSSLMETEKTMKYHIRERDLVLIRKQKRMTLAIPISQMLKVRAIFQTAS